MKLTVFLLYLGFVSLCSRAQFNSLNYLIHQVSEHSLKTFEDTIAGTRFEGRMPGTTGDLLATGFIAELYRKYRLSNPFKTATSYLQDVPLAYLDYSKSLLTVGGKEYAPDDQWTYDTGSDGLPSTTAELVFIGYGISIPKFDELKDLDIEGKFVLMNWNNPKDSTGKDIIESKDRPEAVDRIKNLIKKKALGSFLYAPDFATLDSLVTDFRKTEPFFDYSKENSSKIPACLISAELSRLAVGLNLDSIYSLIGNSARPHSFNTHKQLTLSIVKTVRKTSTKNIIGLLPGTNPDLPCIVLSAHHDHFGRIDGKVYYGADDNGTGTAALLEIARILSDAVREGIRPKRSIVFLSTGAEEQGLIGGMYYADNPVIPLSKTYCNINIDMIGRMDSFHTRNKSDTDYVYCLYYDTSNKVFTASMLDSVNSECCHLTLDTLYNKRAKRPGASGLITRSDNFAFIEKGIPAIFIFGGFHKDYHQPTDTPDKIDYRLLRRRTQLALTMLWRLANE